MNAAAGVKTREEMPFALSDELKWAPKVAKREAAWMRVELARVMQGVGVTCLPACCDSAGRNVFVKSLITRREGPAELGGGTRTRCAIYPYVVDGCTAYVINFATKEADIILKEHGLGTMPCGNPNCKGRNGEWHTKATK